jgi:mannose-1-phosphate guanylyltransferase
MLTDVDLTSMLAFQRARGAAATLALMRVADPTAYGMVETGPDGRILRYVEKPEPGAVTTDTVNAGLYLLERVVLDRIPAGRPVSIEREIFPALVAEGLPLFAWLQPAYWLDIGSPAKYRQGQMDLLAERVRTRVAGPALPGPEVTLARDAVLTLPLVVGRGSRLGPRCRVGPSVVVGADCEVGEGAMLEGTVLWDGVRVGARAVVTDSVVGAAAEIGDGACVGPGAVLGAGAVVAPGARCTA